MQLKMKRQTITTMLTRGKEFAETAYLRELRQYKQAVKAKMEEYLTQMGDDTPVDVKITDQPPKPDTLKFDRLMQIVATAPFIEMRIGHTDIKVELVE